MVNLISSDLSSNNLGMGVVEPLEASKARKKSGKKVKSINEEEMLKRKGKIRNQRLMLGKRNKILNS